MSTYNGKSYQTPRNIRIKEGLIKFDATHTANPFGDEAYGLYVDASTAKLMFRSLTTTYTLDGGGGGGTPSWDAIYNGDKTLTVSGTTFTIDGTHATNNVLTLTSTGAGSGHVLQITNVGTGYDINGTSDTWSFSKTGDGICNTMTMAGDAGSNSLTLTAGDVVFSDGSLAITDADNAATFTVTNNTATTASVIVLAGSGVFTGNTTSSFMTLTASGLTTGTVLYIPVAGLTTGKGINLIGTTALTTGIMLNIESGTTGTSLTGAGRMLYVNHTGTGTSTGTLSEFASAATDETVILKVTASGALALGTALAISGSSITTGKGLTINDLDALTDGYGIHVKSTATAISSTGRLLLVEHATSTTTTSGVIAEIKTAATDETILMKLTTAAMVTGIALNIVGTTGMTSGSLIRATSSTAGAVATNGIYSFKSTGAFTSTSNCGLVDIGATATTAGTVVHITSSAAGQTATSLLYVEASGFTTGYTGDVATFKSSSTTGDSSVVAISAANTTDGTGLKVTSACTTTNGKAIEVIAEGLTTGTGILFAHTTSVIADGGSMLRLSDSGVATGGATNGTMLDIQSTGSVAGTLVKIVSNVASQTSTCLLDVVAAGYTTGYTGSVVKITGVSTTGASNVLLVTGANTTAGNTVKIDAAAITTGTGLLVTSAGVIVTTGELVSLVANGATTCTGVLRASATSLTDGWVAEFTGGGANFSASGGMLNLQMGAATVGTGINITTSGVYTGTTGLLDINAASATTGTIVDISAAGLTEGVALKITLAEATLTSGDYIQCYDGAAVDFKVEKYGATTIAGNAVGTAALTITAGDLVLGSGTILYRDKTEVVTAANVITAAESGSVYFLNSATEFASTLPAPAAGLTFTFIVSAAPSGASYTITTDSSANIIVGNSASAEDAAGSCDFEITGCDTISFVDGKAVKGDWVKVWCDGTNWYATGIASVQDAITYTTAS